MKSLNIKYELDFINYNYRRFCLILSFLSTIGIYFYYEFPWELKSSSFLMIFVFVFYYKIWNYILEKKFKNMFMEYRDYIILGIVSFVFSIIQLVCKFLDNELSCNFTQAFFSSLLLCLSVYPLLLLLFRNLINIEIKEIQICSKKMKIVCFAIICLFWLFVWLAAFPGIYANDAPYWYFEFANKEIPVTTKWSPVYAALFYYFIHLGYVLTNTYEAGLAVFTFLQMSLILLATYKIFSFCCKHGGKVACVLCTIFFSLPIHAIMSVQTSLDAAFMACFSIIIITVIEVLENSENGFDNKRKFVKLVIFIVLSGVFRDNGILTSCLVLPFIFVVM